MYVRQIKLGCLFLSQSSFKSGFKIQTLKFISCLALLLFLAGCRSASALPDSAVKSKTQPIQKLAEPFQADESKYGCGPLLQPGKTYYVSIKGDDKGSGLSWETAWRSVWHGASQLKAGDTLIIGEGEYLENEIQVNVLETSHAEGGKILAPQIGEPGKPIRIMAAPRQRVVITGADLLKNFKKTLGANYTYEAVLNKKEITTIWEADTHIELQDARLIVNVDKLPGAFCYDETNKKLYVRFSDSRGPEFHGVRIRGPRVGLRIHGNYVHVKGLCFKHYGTALMIRPNANKERTILLHGHHNTVEDCVFFANDTDGINPTVGAKWCLIKNNYGYQTGRRGFIRMQGAPTMDNLFVGNWADSSAWTIRTDPGAITHNGIGTYGGLGARNHVINNVLNDSMSLFWKPVCKQAVVQGNIMTGVFKTESGSEKIITKEEDRVIIRNNVILGSVQWRRELAEDAPNNDFSSTDKAFVNNFSGYHNSRGIADARFADPAYLDYRLQSDSSLLSKGIDGYSRGAFARQNNRIYYISPKGDDNAPGASVQSAFQTFNKGASVLCAGDTLYILPGKYSTPLILTTSGKPEAMIYVRAHGKGEVEIPGLVVEGAYITLDGFTVKKSDGDGIAIMKPQVTIKNCLIYNCAGAGIKAQDAAELTVSHCTVTSNAIGLQLINSTNSTVRDSIFSLNHKGAFDIPEKSLPGFKAGNNCYYGDNLDEKRIAGEYGSVIADPMFYKPQENDFRLKYESPAAFLALSAKRAGAKMFVERKPEITSVEAINILPTSAVIIWETTVDDSTGELFYRLRGDGKWKSEPSPKYNTTHVAGLIELSPDKEYEYKLKISGRRGGSSESEIMLFRTTLETKPPATYYLSPNGNDQMDGLSPANAWRSVQKACMFVAPGDTVLITPGVYQHAFIPIIGGLPNQPITFKREGEGIVLIDGYKFVAPLVYLIRKNYMTFEGLTFSGLPDYYSSGGIFWLEHCIGIKIINCRIGAKERVSERSGSALRAVGCKDLLFADNVSWGTRYHCEVYGSSDIIIRSNTFVGSAIFAGFFEGNCANVTILNNIWYLPCVPDKNAPAIMFRGGGITNVTCDYNLFFSPYPHHKVGGIAGPRLETLVDGTNLAKWQKGSGYDQHSVQNDPMFIDIEKGDFRLKPGSPAIGSGKDGVNIGACGAEK